MQDMLVKLLDIPSSEECIKELKKEGINIRRAMVPDMFRIVEFVDKLMGKYAAAECQICFSRQPVSCFIAERKGQLLGFACYETTMRDFFGPTGVNEEERGKNIGKALLLKCLESMREMGYAYAIIGGVGPAAFYEKCCGASLIEDSTPSVYKDFLKYL